MKDYHDESYRTRTFTHLHTTNTHILLRTFHTIIWKSSSIIRLSVCLIFILHFVSNKMDMNEERLVLFIYSNPYNFEYLKIKMSYRGSNINKRRP